MKLSVALKDGKNYYGEVLTRENNTLSITLANAPKLTEVTECKLQVTIEGKLDNLSANGFAFLTHDRYFATHKDVDIRVKIHYFDLPQHDELEGHVIRCSNNEGLYIVGCQMPGDDFFIRDYVKGKL